MKRLGLAAVGHFRSEVAAFLTRFEKSPRQKPEMPPYASASGPEEHKRRADPVGADLARKPTWAG